MDDEAILEQEALMQAEEEENDADRKARRQALFRDKAEGGEANPRMRNVANRFLRNTKKGRLLLGAGKKPKKPTLTKTDYAVLMSIAALFDTISVLLNLIPYVGGVISMVIVTIPGTFTLYLLYKRRGIEFKSTKSIVRFWGSSFIEAIPIINVLPAFMLNVTLVYSTEKFEALKKK